MKRLSLISTVVVSSSLFLTQPASAQHGHGMGPGLSHSSGNHAMGSGRRAQKTMAQKLTDNKQLADKISKLTGMSATSACDGFKNLGQCVAAAHVAKNLNLQGGFLGLKDKMLGLSPNGTASTTSKPMSLGKAIQNLDPTVNSRAAAATAKKQASQDIKDSGGNS
ncbi:MAG TPA: hypothetical protein VE994_18470 [Terriglobales bacterium]|nr:hypothetical protein [Terriglobales bacterium]